MQRQKRREMWFSWSRVFVRGFGGNTCTGMYAWSWARQAQVSRIYEGRGLTPRCALPERLRLYPGRGQVTCQFWFKMVESWFSQLSNHRLERGVHDEPGLSELAGSSPDFSRSRRSQRAPGPRPRTARLSVSVANRRKPPFAPVRTDLARDYTPAIRIPNPIALRPHPENGSSAGTARGGAHAGGSCGSPR